MAISINKFIDIQTTFPSADAPARSFGGLVFVPEECTAVPPEGSRLAALKKDFNDFKVVQVTNTDVTYLFGEDSYITKFADGYYNYESPTNRYASMLSIVRLNGTVSLKQNFINAYNSTNMFGSFTFLPKEQDGSDSDSDPDYNLGGYDAADLYAVSQENDNLNARFLFVVNSVRADTDVDGSVTIADKNSSCGGYGDGMNETCEGTVYVSGAYPWSSYMPMAIFAATDYVEGTVTNHMFKQFPGEMPTVKDDATFDAFNANQINFYGQSQTNGQTLNFYQRGFNTNKVESAIYCNEVWLKSACEAELTGVFMNNERVPANDDGVAEVVSAVFNVCGTAVGNGMFMVKQMRDVEARKLRKFLANIGAPTDTAEAIVSDVERVGYAVYGYYTYDEAKGEYYIHYFIFYGTADSVRYIKGDDILIK